MNTKLLFGILTIGLLLICSIIGGFAMGDLVPISDDDVYQGPIRPTDDLEHFRKTGETIPLEVNNNGVV